MKLKKQIFLPILLSLSVFFTSSVTAPAAAYASVMPQVRAAALREAAVKDGPARPAGSAARELAAAASDRSGIPEAGRGNAGRSGDARADDDSSFFGRVLEKLAVMFLLYMFLEAISEILNDFFRDGDTKIKVTPKENRNGPEKGTQQNRNLKRIPAQDV